MIVSLPAENILHKLATAPETFRSADGELLFLPGCVDTLATIGASPVAESPPSRGFSFSRLAGLRELNCEKAAVLRSLMHVALATCCWLGRSSQALQCVLAAQTPSQPFSSLLTFLLKQDF